MSVVPTWLVAAPQVLRVIFLLGLWFYVLLRPMNSKSAKTLLLIGLGIFAVAPIAHWACMMILTRWNAYGSDGGLLMIGLLNLISTVIHLIALSLIVAAALTGRTPHEATSTATFGVASENNNPYQPPSI